MGGSIPKMLLLLLGLSQTSRLEAEQVQTISLSINNNSNHGPPEYCSTLSREPLQSSSLHNTGFCNNSNSNVSVVVQLSITFRGVISELESDSVSLGANIQLEDPGGSGRTYSSGVIPLQFTLPQNEKLQSLIAAVIILVIILIIVGIILILVIVGWCCTCKKLKKKDLAHKNEERDTENATSSSSLLKKENTNQMNVVMGPRRKVERAEIEEILEAPLDDETIPTNEEAKEKEKFKDELLARCKNIPSCMKNLLIKKGARSKQPRGTISDKAGYVSVAPPLQDPEGYIRVVHPSDALGRPLSIQVELSPGLTRPLLDKDGYIRVSSPHQRPHSAQGGLAPVQDGHSNSPLEKQREISSPHQDKRPCSAQAEIIQAQQQGPKYSAVILKSKAKGGGDNHDKDDDYEPIGFQGSIDDDDEDDIVMEPNKVYGINSKSDVTLKESTKNKLSVKEYDYYSHQVF